MARAAATLAAVTRGSSPPKRQRGAWGVVWEKPRFEVINLCLEVTAYIYTR